MWCDDDRGAVCRYRAVVCRYCRSHCRDVECHDAAHRTVLSTRHAIDTMTPHAIVIDIVHAGHPGGAACTAMVRDARALPALLAVRAEGIKISVRRYQNGGGPCQPIGLRP